MPFDSLPVTSPVIEMLRKGRALIEERGLAKGEFQDMHGKFCTVGAIARQGYVWQDYTVVLLTDTIALAIEYLDKAHPNRRDTIVWWNDMPERTQADVLALYDRAIDLAIADVI